MCDSCGGHGHGHHHGAELHDPVCGIEVRENSPFQAVHAGETFRFCSEKCKADFEKDPAKFAAHTHA